MTDDDKAAGKAIAAYEILELIDALTKRMAKVAGNRGYNGNKKLEALRHLMLLEAQLQTTVARLAVARTNTKGVTE